MSSASLSHRLQTLSDTYKATLSLIQELQKFPAGSSPLSDDLDEQRLELANSCHQNLKDAEENLELLRQDVDDYSTRKQGRRSITSARDDEQERNATTVARLTEDIRSARGAFRRAQLQSKKNLDSRKQKEREQLFANRRGGGIDGPDSTVPTRRRGEKLTQDELAQNAADDVTKALRRTHALLSSNLQQSQFAQQTLDESQLQLQSLSQRYTGTTDMLQKSRGLVSTLVKSQKSDTWYLLTSVYILIVTLAWLVFRRWLYGPLWWFVWLPVKYLWWAATLVLGPANTTAVRAANNNTAVVGTKTRLDVPTNPPDVDWKHHVIPNKGAGWADKSESEEDLPPSPEMVEKVKKMIQEGTKESVIVDESDPHERNPKKRMMELEQEQARIRDEL